MAYDMRDPCIIPTLVFEYSGAVEDCWGGACDDRVLPVAPLIEGFAPCSSPVPKGFLQ